jgi:RNA polymerase sigma factor (sigma-70 family)
MLQQHDLHLNGLSASAAHNLASTDFGLWSATLAGDADAFEELVAPHLDELLKAAGRDLRYHVSLGDLRAEDLTPEELVGETLLRTWRDRCRRPLSRALRPWLLDLQLEVLAQLVDQEEKQPGFISLEAPVPPPPVYDDDEEFWEWYQPDDAARWEDVLPVVGHSREEFALELLETAAPNLSPLARQVFVLRHIDGLSVGEICSALHLPPERVRTLWKEAVTGVLAAMEAHDG